MHRQIRFFLLIIGGNAFSPTITASPFSSDSQSYAMSLAAWLDRQEQLSCEICNCLASDMNVHTGSMAVSADGLGLPQAYEVRDVPSSETLCFGLWPPSLVRSKCKM